ncbi:MAG: 50S ribosomal protein L30 [Nitrospirae bacterium]|nr:50S ribosomal protein L30 [Nitrospirota bacterium]
MKVLRITLKRSLIGRPEKQRKIIKSLGLRRIGHTVMKEDTPVIRGMIQKVPHLLEIDEGEGIV